MKTTETLPSVVRSFPAPKGYTGKIVVTAKAEHLKGNAHPHFSVTAAIGTDRQLQTGDWQAGGCMHEEIAKAWPAIQPIIDLHLANSDDGEPMHAEVNGWYWLAGAMGGMGEQYHGAEGASAKSPDECLRIFAETVRIAPEQAKEVAASLIGQKDAKATFKAWIQAQRERWANEAKAGIELLESLTNN